MSDIYQLLQERILIIDGAMGTELQKVDIPDAAWQGQHGCNELLSKSAPSIIRAVHESYLAAGADIIKTNGFGALPWVLDEYGIGEMARELSFLSAKIAKESAEKFSTPEKPRFVAASIGPGTKLPSLGHIGFDEMHAGYKTAILGAIEGEADLLLFETCQDPLQIKCALIAANDAFPEAGRTLPIIVSATIEMTGAMLIGTDILTLAAILSPFKLLALGINCGTGPDEMRRHLHTLSECWSGRISAHANAGLPQNIGGCTHYPMGMEEFAEIQSEFAGLPSVSILGGCCGTTPAHIEALSKKLNLAKPKPSVAKPAASLASLFGAAALMQEPPPFLVGERSNATGSKAFRELLLKSDFEGTLEVAREQVNSGAHALDVSVGFAGRDESGDMSRVAALYNKNIALPLMIDSTQLSALEAGLKCVGGKAIINSVNLEDGEGKFDAICRLAKRYGTSLVCLCIDEVGMAKSKERKLEIAERIYELATKRHGLSGDELVFDMLTFTVGSGDDEYLDAATQTIDAIEEFRARHPECGTVLGVSNISFGLTKRSREYLNSVFLRHCVENGLTMAIVNVANTMPYHKMQPDDIAVCEELLFRAKPSSETLFAFIEHFKDADTSVPEVQNESKSSTELIREYLKNGEKPKMLTLLATAKDEIAPERIVNELLIDAMKEVGELFGSGKMQLPFVLQSAETMKAAVDFLQPYLPKSEKQSKTTLIIGTVKGDVHDVGKNLVDIILSNNGFHVVNIGIKAGVEEFIKALKEHKADALGMSGLLVKSTQVMVENLEELKRRGISIPVLLGGAALNRRFVEEYCKSVYDGEVYYCKDAFDGLMAISSVESGAGVAEYEKNAFKEPLATLEKAAELPFSETMIVMPAKAENIPMPPFLGENILSGAVLDAKELFSWLNLDTLLKQRWGYKKGDMGAVEYEKLMRQTVQPTYERLKAQFLQDALIEPRAVYGYYAARSEKGSLILDGGERFIFPRAKKEPFRSLPDYFSPEKDILPIFVVSVGCEKLLEFESRLYKEASYHEYYLVHGLGVELAEALAEVVHFRIRSELGIVEAGEKERVQGGSYRYRGQRYSPGYPACPDLALNEQIFALLRPERLGITLSETHQMHPEQSVSAFVVHHQEAKYFSV